MDVAVSVVPTVPLPIPPHNSGLCLCDAPIKAMSRDMACCSVFVTIVFVNSCLTVCGHVGNI